MLKVGAASERLLFAMIPLLSFFAALVISATVPALLAALALWSWRRLPADPWTERARLLHPIRTGHGVWVIILPLSAVVARAWLFPDASLPAILFGTILGGALSGWPLDRAVFPTLAFRTWFYSSLTVSLIRLSLAFLVFLFAATMPSEWSPAQLGWAAAFLLATGAVSTGLVHRLLVVLGTLKPARQHLQELVNNCASEAGIPVKTVWELPSPAAFAAVLIVQRALIFSTATATEHDDEELRAICRHELAHLNEGPLLIAVRVAQLPIALLPVIFVPSMIASIGPLGVLPPLFAWIFLQRTFARLSLRLEKKADAAAHRDVESPAYARALERIHCRNLVPAILAAKAARTHPDLYDRMLAAGVTPEFPRPEPPPASHWIQISGQLLSGATMLVWMICVN